MSSSSATATASRSPSPATPDSSDSCLNHVAIAQQNHNFSDFEPSASSWASPGNINGTFAAADVWGIAVEKNDEQQQQLPMLPFDDLIEEHAYTECVSTRLIRYD